MQMDRFFIINQSDSYKWHTLERTHFWLIPFMGLVSPNAACLVADISSALQLWHDITMVSVQWIELYGQHDQF